MRGRPCALPRIGLEPSHAKLQGLAQAGASTGRARAEVLRLTNRTGLGRAGVKPILLGCSPRPSPPCPNL